MTTSSATQSAQTPSTPLPFTFGGFTVPAGCRRVFITAELEPSNGDPRIQPTGFPEVGPVLYADPAEKDGLICLIESEASMANRLEEVCLENKYEGTLRTELEGLPYIKLTDDGTTEGALITASTLDGHRFASEYIMSGHIVQQGSELAAVSAGAKTTADGNRNKKGKSTATKPGSQPDPEFVKFVQTFMGMATKDRCPAANVPRVFQLAMAYDPLSLLHGFQISVKDKLTFVGLRSPRAITASIMGLGCERIVVPGVRFDPIGTAKASQAIFQKPRISARRIEARFAVDIGLLAGMDLGLDSDAKINLLFAIALCKVSWFLAELQKSLRLRTDCDLRAVAKKCWYWIDRLEGDGREFDADPIVAHAAKHLPELVKQCTFEDGHSPFPLKYVRKAKEETKSGASDDPSIQADEEEEEETSENED